MRNYLILSYLLLFNYSAASNLPLCPFQEDIDYEVTKATIYPGTDNNIFNSSYTNCFGIYDYNKIDGLDVYKGEWKNGKRHGEGTFLYKDGSQYKGDWSLDIKSGAGEQIYPDGTKYKGNWKNNKYHGMGEINYPDKQAYIGEFLNGKVEGQGTMNYPGGEVYVGRFKNGIRHGKGTFILAGGFEMKDMWYQGKAASKLCEKRGYTESSGFKLKCIQKYEEKVYVTDTSEISNTDVSPNIDSPKLEIAYLDRDAQPISRVPPVMPSGAEKSGYCNVKFDVTSEGTPFNIITTFCTQRVFKLETIRSVQRWKYKPKIVDGRAVTRKGVENRVSYRLTDERGRIIPF